MMDQERQTIMSELSKADVSVLHPPDDENALIHKLIGQYLAHEGYVETAKAFARDVDDQQQSLSTEPQAFQASDSDDDIHAINRQKIRKSILDGDIDRALKYTGSYYPHVLLEERNKDIYFRLRCRKFIEMMRRYSELATATSSPAMTKSVDSLASNGHSDGAPLMAEMGDGEEGQDTQMELDDQLHREVSKGLEPPPTDDIDMDASQELPLKASFMKQGDLLGATLSYGQELQQEFGSDPRQHIKKQLTELFAIIAYPNPADSPIGALLDQSGRVQIAEEVNGAILGETRSWNLLVTRTDFAGSLPWQTVFRSAGKALRADRSPARRDSEQDWRSSGFHQCADRFSAGIASIGIFISTQDTARWEESWWVKFGAR